MDDLISRQAAIDADGVSEILTRVIEEQKKSHHVDEVIGLMEAKTEVNNAPTLDVKPVVHAHWIEHRANNGNVYYTCSHCGKKVSYPYAKKRWKYCIECGAKMDGEKYMSCNLCPLCHANGEY